MMIYDIPVTPQISNLAAHGRPGISGPKMSVLERYLGERQGRPRRGWAPSIFAIPRIWACPAWLPMQNRNTYARSATHSERQRWNEAGGLEIILWVRFVIVNLSVDHNRVGCSAKSLEMHLTPSNSATLVFAKYFKSCPVRTGWFAAAGRIQPGHARADSAPTDTETVFYLFSKSCQSRVPSWKPGISHPREAHMIRVSGTTPARSQSCLRGAHGQT